jgi:hypothetical protein
MSEFLDEPLCSGLCFRDLNAPNALADVLHALTHLDSLVDTVFGNISGKIEQEMARLGDVNERLGVAQNGIQSITGSSRATTVFSTSKFPAPKTLPDYSRLHLGSHGDKLGPTYPEPEEEKDYQVGDTRLSALASAAQVQSLLDMFTKLNLHGTDNVDPAFTMEREGLWRVPNTAVSTGSLLLYNSTQNPYKSYRSQFDNLAEAEGHKEKAPEVKAALADQPESVASGILLPDVADFNYGYVPGSTEGQVMLNLPSNIELPGVASDLSYGFTGGSAIGTIVPSAFKNDNFLLPDLPQIEWKPAEPTSQPASARAAAPSAAAPPPPPPPPPPPAKPAAARRGPAASPAGSPTLLRRA